jgi:hypothetical protein
MTCLFLRVFPVSAATITWSGAGDNTNWFNPTNWSGAAVPGPADNAVIANGPTVIVLNSNVTVLALDISNRTLRFMGWSPEAAPSNVLTAGNIFIRNGARFTQGTNSATATNPVTGQWDPDNGIFIVCTNLTVFVGGEINCNGTGYRGGATGTNGYGPGQGRYFSGDWGGGGGYGGAGGCGSNALAYGGVANGTAADPNNTGSGGGGGNGRGALGGGYVKIVAVETVNVAGVISVSGAGARSSSKAGGGSGGGVYIRCRSLTGGGAIQANGGAGAPAGGGGGGGGRIAVFASQAPFYTIGLQYNVAPGAGGTNAMPGSPGTIHLDFKPRGTMFSAW